jgi:cell division protein FtsI (penicillin-binding protein 3)
LRLLLLAAVTVALLLAAQIAHVQVLRAGGLSERAARQLIRTDKLPATRGSIFDRNGRDLVVSIDVRTIAADPSLVTDPLGEATQLQPILGTPVPDLVDRLSRRNTRFVYLARRVDDRIADMVRDLKLPGIFTIFQPKRFQPAENLAVPVLGRVGVDNEGLSGIERQYDDVLKGHPGRLVTERDQQGREIPGARIEYDPMARGDDLVLTIDRSIQFETERRLGAQITATHAKGGIAMVMDTRTGDLLAVADLTVDPETGAVVPADRNTAVTNVYEPGSTAKLVTIAAAIEEQAVRSADVLRVPSHVQVGDHTYDEHEPHPVVNWSITDIVANSSNVGTILVARQLGKEKFDGYLRKFGFGSKTALRAPGESAGILLDTDDYAQSSMGSLPIGQGFAVTSAQVLAAYNTIANGGLYVPPRVVRASVGPDGTQHAAPAPETRRVVSEQTATDLTHMLADVVRVGTGELAAIDGYTVSGKTGTARKPKEGARGYEEGAYVSSFAGFVPAEDPRLTMLVLLDEPVPIYGGLVAAPVFADIGRYALREMRIPPPSARMKPSSVRAATAATAKGVGDLGDAQAPASLPSTTTSTSAAPSSSTSSTRGSSTSSSRPAQTTTTRPPRRATSTTVTTVFPG